MATVTAASWVPACLLVAAGVAKITTPTATGGALRTSGLPSRTALVRLLGAGEVALGLLVLAIGGTSTAVAMAGAYAAFTGVAWRQRRAGADCSCFGASSAPATALHVSVDATAAAVAAAAAVAPAPALGPVVAADPVAGVLAGLAVVVATALVRLLLTAAPELAAEVARTRQAART